MRMRKISLSGAFSAVVLMMAAVVGFGLVLPARGMDRLNPRTADNSLAEQVRHQLVMLPHFGVFDDLRYEVKNGGEVMLTGEVTRPTLRSDAEKAVSRVAGVEKVDDNIQVLPLSSFDDRIRMATFRAVYNNDQLVRYALQAVPPIHIIVDNGRVTLVGVVAKQADKDVAGMMASRVFGVFSVTNNLTVESKKGKS
jgi:hyperosmotically inducible protein